MNADSLLIQGIEVINHLVTDCDFAASHNALTIMRRHLDSRIEQTRPLEDNDDDDDDGSDLL